MSKKDRLTTRIRKNLKPNTYVVPVSGGKDSQLVLSNAVREHGRERVIALHNYTGIDHPLTMEHMKYMEGLYGVPIERTVNPKYKDMWDLLDKRNIIPGRTSRFCTDELKIQTMNHWLKGRSDLRELVVLMGMRAGESQQRAANYADLSPLDEFSLRDLNPHKVWASVKMVRARLPIVNLSTSQVFDTLRERGEKVNPLYARGHTRVGCYPCILAGKHDYRLAARDPVGRETVITLRDFKAVIAEVRKDKLTPEMLIPHDLDAMLDEQDQDPFGFKAPGDDDGAAGCSWCAQ